MVDEAQDVRPDKYDKDIAPMAASTNATRVFWGTAWTAQTLLARELRAAREAERIDGRRRAWVVDADQVAAEVPAYGAFVAAQVARLGRMHPLVRTQFYSEEIEAGGGMFPPERRERMRGSHAPLDGPRPGMAYAFLLDVAGADEVAGADSLDPETALQAGAARRDATALTVVEVDPRDLAGGRGPVYRAVARRMWVGTRHVELYDELVALAGRWQARHLVVDATGVGAGLASFLGRALPGRVIPFTFTAASKSKLGWDFWPWRTPAAGRGRRPRDRRAARVRGKRLRPALGAVLPPAGRLPVPGPARPGRALRWGVPDGARDPLSGERLRDDLVLSAALVTVLDGLSWSAGRPAAVLRAPDRSKRWTAAGDPGSIEYQQGGHMTLQSWINRLAGRGRARLASQPAIIDPDFRPAGGSPLSATGRCGTGRILRQALEAWQSNPLARRIVELTTQYVTGGGLTITSPGPAAQEFLRQWWNHPLNQGEVRAAEWCDELSRAGEVFFLVSTDAAGMSYLRAVPAAQVSEVLTAGNDLQQETGYRLRPLRPEDGPEGRVWPAYDPAADRPGADGRFPVVMVHYAVNRPVGALRGESDLAPLLRWLSRYAAWLEDRARLNRFRTAFLYVVRTRFTSEAERQARQAALQASPPTPGSILVTDESESWEVINPQLASDEAASDGLALKKMIAAGAGLPLHFLAEPESATRTTAESSGRAWPSAAWSSASASSAGWWPTWPGWPCAAAPRWTRPWPDPPRPGWRCTGPTSRRATTATWPPRPPKSPRRWPRCTPAGCCRPGSCCGWCTASPGRRSTWRRCSGRRGRSPTVKPTPRRAYEPTSPHRPHA